MNVAGVERGGGRGLDITVCKTLEPLYFNVIGVMTRMSIIGALGEIYVISPDREGKISLCLLTYIAGAALLS
nr:hypothetical protein Iba_scaffold16074CG0040 [Ipomoea batatas]